MSLSLRSRRSWIRPLLVVWALALQPDGRVPASAGATVAVVSASAVMS